MVCNRCINSVRSLLNELNLHYNNIQLGEVELDKALDKQQEALLREKLQGGV